MFFMSTVAQVLKKFLRLLENNNYTYTDNYRLISGIANMFSDIL